MFSFPIVALFLWPQMSLKPTWNTKATVQSNRNLLCCKAGHCRVSSQASSPASDTTRSRCKDPHTLHHSISVTLWRDWSSDIGVPCLSAVKIYIPLDSFGSDFKSRFHGLEVDLKHSYDVMALCFIQDLGLSLMHENGSLNWYLVQAVFQSIRSEGSESNPH